jgi:hypothetical protein
MKRSTDKSSRTCKANTETTRRVMLVSPAQLALQAKNSCSRYALSADLTSALPALRSELRPVI